MSRFQNQEVNVYNIWRKVLDENEKIAKAKLAAVQVFVEEVEKDAKVVKAEKQTKTKKHFEKLAHVQKDLQASVGEVSWHFLLISKLRKLRDLCGELQLKATSTLSNTGYFPR